MVYISIYRMEGSFVIFQLEELFCALPCETVSEVLPMAEFFSPPQMPSVLAGFLNLEGRAIPVLKLSRLFFPGERKAPGGSLYSHLILVRSKLRSFFLQVERAIEVKSFPEEALLPVESGHSLGNCVEAQTEEAGRKIYILSPDRLFLREEEERIKGLQVLEQERIREVQLHPQ